MFVSIWHGEACACKRPQSANLSALASSAYNANDIHGEITPVFNFCSLECTQWLRAERHKGTAVTC